MRQLALAFGLHPGCAYHKTACCRGSTFLNGSFRHGANRCASNTSSSSALAGFKKGGAAPISPSSSSTSSSHPGIRRPPKVLVRPLPPFIDDRYPGPDSHVAAFLLDTRIDLQRLKSKLMELGVPTVLWQGQILHSGSSAQLGQQQCSAVFLPDGCAVLWHMSRANELLMLKLAASCMKPRRGPPRFSGVSRLPAERMDQLGLHAPLAEERLEVSDAPAGVITAVHPQDGSVKLTRDPLARASHQLGLSLGLAVAVRLDALERQIESKLEEDWKGIAREASHHLNLSAVSHRIFDMETGLHDLRYELNSEAGLVDAPELLWEHALAERLYDQVVAHHDTRRRTALLNERLSYSLDYLSTLSEHVRHRYSVRLEVIIIVLIFLELCVALISHPPGLLGAVFASPAQPAAKAQEEVS